MWTGENDLNTVTCGRGSFCNRENIYAVFNLHGYVWAWPQASDETMPRQGSQATVNPDKIQLRLDQMSYMGHRITANGLKINPEKTEAIRKMPVPIDKQMFAAKLAESTTPLRNFTEERKYIQMGGTSALKALDDRLG